MSGSAVPWKESPASMAAAWIAGMHLLATLLAGALYLVTEDVHPVFGRSEGLNRIGVLTLYVIAVLALLPSGLLVSLFAPGWRRKLLLLGANFLPASWLLVPFGYVAYFMATH